MSELKNKLIRLGSTNPALRPHLRPILAELEKTATPSFGDLRSELGKASSLTAVAKLIRRHGLDDPNRFEDEVWPYILSTVERWDDSQKKISDEEIDGIVKLRHRTLAQLLWDTPDKEWLPYYYYLLKMVGSSFRGRGPTDFDDVAPLLRAVRAPYFTISDIYLPIQSQGFIPPRGQKLYGDKVVVSTTSPISDFMGVSAELDNTLATLRSFQHIRNLEFGPTFWRGGDANFLQDTLIEYLRPRVREFQALNVTTLVWSTPRDLKPELAALLTRIER